MTIRLYRVRILVYKRESKKDEFEDFMNTELKSIPSGIYYSIEHDNFYAIGTNAGMSDKFYREWKFRYSEFPNTSTNNVLPGQVFNVGDVVVAIKSRLCGLFEVGEIGIVHKDDAPTYVIEAEGCSVSRTSDEIRRATPTECHKFFALNPTKHPNYVTTMGDMSGWRYLRLGEKFLYGDEFYYESKWSEQVIYIGKIHDLSYTIHRRRVDSEGNDIIEPLKIIIDREGVYRRYDGRLVLITKLDRSEYHDKIGSTREYIELKHGILYSKTGIHNYYPQKSVVKYLAPLPPNNANLLDIKVGEKLPCKVYIFCLAHKFSEWYPPKRHYHTVVQEGYLYAKYTDPPDTTVDSSSNTEFFHYNPSEAGHWITTRVTPWREIPTVIDCIGATWNSKDGK